MNHFEYFTDIENHFVKRRGKHLMIGPLDWSLIESWQTRGVPLKVVLRAIDDVFDAFEQQGKDPSRIRSLKYCSDAVDSVFADWNRTQTGKYRAEDVANPDQADSFSRHIDLSIGRIIDILDLVPVRLKSVLQDSLVVLRELSASSDIENLEDRLDALDAAIDRSIIENRDEYLKGSLIAAVEKTAAEFGIEYNTADADFERIVAKTARSHFGIPRLGLYRL